eukprot:GEZU01004813.1.p1 GENE.GEZU01004813.1~~GEZU01004813.1.p1  ORF type:complete len:127 (-),score=35.18 GEZU01004813.1:20-349(-)
MQTVSDCFLRMAQLLIPATAFVPDERFVIMGIGSGNNNHYPSSVQGLLRRAQPQEERIAQFMQLYRDHPEIDDWVLQLKEAAPDAWAKYEQQEQSFGTAASAPMMTDLD